MWGWGAPCEPDAAGAEVLDRVPELRARTRLSNEWLHAKRGWASVGCGVRVRGMGVGLPGFDSDGR